MGSRLKRLRTAAGFSQTRLAEASGVPIGTLRNWEQDRRTPLLDTAARVAAVLGVTLDELAKQLQPDPPAPAARRGRGKKTGGSQL
jgi:transcriptional regulator with XRE-family HTH domain